MYANLLPDPESLQARSESQKLCGFRLPVETVSLRFHETSEQVDALLGKVPIDNSGQIASWLREWRQLPADQKLYLAEWLISFADVHAPGLRIDPTAPRLLAAMRRYQARHTVQPGIDPAFQNPKITI
jgi:hypothetical protein